jgi:carboxymethylenebutenolidase
VNRRAALRFLSISPSLALLSDAIAAKPPKAVADIPETVSFVSADGKTRLTGYLFRSTGMPRGRLPAVVMMHGRAGPYSSLAKGRYDATTLTKRHMHWGQFWADRGGFALLVDSFGPRGVPAGFKAGTYDERPDDINEITVRPLDAYGARSWLAKRTDVDAGRIGLQGWSNGGSAVLATMSTELLREAGLERRDGFRAALAFYPGCGLQGRFKGSYTPYAPVRVLIGTADEEVLPDRCKALVGESRGRGSDIELALYRDATHDFDDPGRRRQSVAANVAAYGEATKLAAQFMGQHIGI